MTGAADVARESGSGLRVVTIGDGEIPNDRSRDRAPVHPAHTGFTVCGIYWLSLPVIVGSLIELTTLAVLAFRRGAK